MKWSNVLLYLLVAACGGALVLVGVNLWPGPQHVSRPLVHQYGVTDPQFVQSMAAISGGAKVEGHQVETLINGDEIFPAMLGAISAAKTSINFETYIYWSGRIGLQFAQSLAARSRAGVKVRVLVDWAGSIPFDQKLIDMMVNAGVAFHRFRPVHWYTLDRLNNRTHRKLLIVDGTVGFTGGVGIGDNWLGDAGNPEEWRDSHFRVTGPAVTSMQAAFAANWLEATGELLDGEKMFPAQDASGPLGGQLTISTQPSGSTVLHLMMLMALSAAEKNIRIGMAYFVPDDVMLQQLLDARERGVEIDIIVPNAHTDVPIVRKGSRYFWGDLLRAGVRIYEFQPTMYHPKFIIADEAWVTVGSANLDERSLRLNDEANLNVFGREFAVEQIEVFNKDLSRSRQISFEEWQNRPLMEKITDWFASLLRSQI